MEELHICACCGLEYNAMFEKCPGCNAENIEKTHAEYHEKLRNLEKQRGNVFEEMEASLNKRSKISLKIIIRVVLVCAVLFLIYSFISGAFLKTKYNREEKAIAKAQELYDASEYETLVEEFEDKYYAGKIGDYYAVSYYYVRMEQNIDFLNESIDYAKAYPENDDNEEFIYDSLRYCIDELYDVVNYSSMSSADISKGLSDTKELCINRLKEISNVDLEQMLEMLSSVTDEIEYEDEKKLIEEVTTLIYERMVPINEM